jgi:nitroreductase
MDGQTALSIETFYNMMGRLIPTQEAIAPWDVFSWRPRIHLGIFVHRVTGLSEGLYVLVRDPKMVESLKASMDSEFLWKKPAGCPIGLSLYLLQVGDFRGKAAGVSCGQNIAGDGAFSLGMIADFQNSLALHGASFYRNLFWEAGLVGQVLYLEAEEAGIRATGIGCYLDDPVHQIFGLTSPKFQSLYHFTVGAPVEDNRLTTLPAYE